MGEESRQLQEQKQILQFVQDDNVGVGGCNVGSGRMQCGEWTAWTALAVEVADGFDYGLLFVFAEFGVDGQGEDFGGGAFGFGEVAWFVA